MGLGRAGNKCLGGNAGLGHGVAIAVGWALNVPALGGPGSLQGVKGGNGNLRQWDPWLPYGSTQG